MIEIILLALLCLSSLGFLVKKIRPSLSFKFIVGGGLIFFVPCFNLLAHIFAVPQGSSEDTYHYDLGVHDVEVQALTYSFAENDNGEALIKVRSKSYKKDFPAYFNYDFWEDIDPVKVKYGFKNMDLFPDLILEVKTSRDSELSHPIYVLGVSGKIIEPLLQSK